MNKLLNALVSLALVSSFSNAFAQNEGVITYEITVNMHRLLPPDQEGRKAMIPQYRTSKQQLFYNASESLYKPLIEDDEEEEQFPSGGGGGGRRMMFRMQGPTNYFEQSSSIMLSQMDVRGKKYLVTDTLKPAPWKFGTETKVILGYDCMQAYYTTDDDRKQTITAWFTSKLRPGLGPEKYNTLPGTILAIDINNGERVFVAKKVEVRELKKNELKAPNDGERISQAEFRVKMEEMRKQFRGGGGNVIIRN